MKYLSAALPLACLILTGLLAGCQPRIQVDIGGGAERELVSSPVLADEGAGDARILMIDVRGMLYDSHRPGLLGQGINPVDSFITKLGMAENDPTIKAVILRITSPGGTVTGSDIMYQELLRFERVTKKPVIASLGEVAASGAYYLAVGTDYIYAEPTSITGSVGVIMPTVNISEGLSKLGIKSRSVKSGANKDIANPLEPIRDSQYAVLQGLIDEYYARFKGIVLEHRKIDPAHIDECTDGRVFSGKKAAELHMIDEVGGVRDAFAKAKSMANLKAATLVKYADKDHPPRTAYSVVETSPTAPAQPSGLTLNMNLANPLSEASPAETSGIYYLWMPAMP